MKEKIKKSLLARIPAWLLSLIILFVTMVLEFILNDPRSTSLSTIQILGWIFIIILVTVACYIICKLHPKSVWYTPLICNGIGIFGLFVNIFLAIGFTLAGQDYGLPLIEWIFIVSSVVLSVAGAIAGANRGQQKIQQPA